MRISILLLALLATIAAYAQEVAIEAAHAHVAYMGVPNPLIITAIDAPCSSLRVSTNNGRLEGNGCRYQYYPARIGYATITIRVGGRVLDEKNLRVKNVPTPTIRIGDNGGGAIARSTITNASGPYAQMADSYPDFSVRLQKCTLVLKKRESNTVLYQRDIEDASNLSFSEEDHRQFALLQRGDSIIIENGRISNPDAQARTPGRATFFLK